MEILRGSPALSAFRINKLLSRCQEARLPVSDIYAEYVHFADVSAPLSSDEQTKLQRLLKYGPSLAEHAPSGRLLLVTRALAPFLRGLPKLPILHTIAACRRLCVWNAVWHFMYRRRN